MRSRNIKPGFFENELLADLDHGARLLFIALWCMADRSGRLEDRPRRVQGHAFRWEPKAPVEKWLDDLFATKFISRYTINGIKFIQINNFEKHQRPHRRESSSLIPPFLSHLNEQGQSKDMPRTVQGALIPDVMIPDMLNGAKDMPGSASPPPPPTSLPTQKAKPKNAAEVTAYAQSIGFALDGEHFWDYQESRGWKVKGGQPIRDWKAAVRTWKRNNLVSSTNGQKTREDYS